MRRSVRSLWRNSEGSVAPTVALSLVALIAAGGVAFDYAQLASMDTELQQAADQAALAAATQLDGKAGAITRAQAAAQSMITNVTKFADDGGGSAVGGMTFTFYASYNQTSVPDSYGTVVTPGAAGADASAKVVKVTIGSRTARYALTPIVGAISGSSTANATASVGNAICKTPPVMLCNPDEPLGNTNEDLAYNPVRGQGLRLVTGDATVPGNFGWLEAAIGNGAPALAGELGYNTPLGECQAITGVTTKTGMDTSVLNALNTRFDVYQNGNNTCPSQYGGTCSPSTNTRKDLVCKPNGAGNGCTNDNWNEAGKPYEPITESPLKSDGSEDPDFIGYPHDLCHAREIGLQSCGVKGDGNWDRAAYFRINYNGTTDWQTLTGLPATASRWDVYSWELTHRSMTVAGKAVGIDAPLIKGNEGSFSYPATGRTGVAASTSQPDRRRIAAAVLNCRALDVHGKTSDVPVPTWLDMFLIEPAWPRGQGSHKFTNQKDVYVEIIGTTNASSANQVIERNKPFLIR
ncbi:pilus assembly protein TadG-related protein [Sphingomonas sp. URHD0057]|uniref:pilus assembly protein TadG-related protein n=1 Tax=Sphingomonas sp. URHD0057 TaxID=1380389 RepID=UPI00048AF08F|nr:pilus assembly protein TadG-related protein [Sphingomonas sp. URHD0057]